MLTWYVLSETFLGLKGIFLVYFDDGALFEDSFTTYGVPFGE